MQVNLMLVFKPPPPALVVSPEAVVSPEGRAHTFIALD